MAYSRTYTFYKVKIQILRNRDYATSWARKERTRKSMARLLPREYSSQLILLGVITWAAELQKRNSGVGEIQTNQSKTPTIQQTECFRGNPMVEQVKKKTAWGCNSRRKTMQLNHKVRYSSTRLVCLQRN